MTTHLDPAMHDPGCGFAPTLGRTSAGILLLAIAYAGTGWLGLQLAVPPGFATMIWPASGIALGALLLYGNRLWAGVLLGSFAVNVLHAAFLSGVTPDARSCAIAALIAAGSALQSLTASHVAGRLFGRPMQFRTVSEVVVFLALICPVACVIAPTIGVATLWWFEMVSAQSAPHNWIAWWSGDALGVLIFFPLVLLNPWRPFDLRWLGRTVAGFSGATLLAIILAIGATLYAWKMTSETAFRQGAIEFRSLTEASERALMHRMDTSLQSLNGGAGLFSASSEVTAQEWRTYSEVLELERTLPGISGIGFIEAAPGAELPELIRRYAGLGVKDLRIGPDTEAKEHFVIVLIEPLAPNRAARGLDITFEKNRLEAAIHSRDTGRPTITRRVLLVQDNTESPGFLLLRPVYRRGAPRGTDAERRTAFAGWVFAPFVGNRFMKDLTTAQGVALHISVYDGDAADPGALIFSSKSERAAPAHAVTPAYRLARTLSLMERDWTVVWESTPLFDAASQSREPSLILFGGLVLSALLGALLLSFSHREDAIRRTVEQKTREITARERENRSIVESAFTGIILTDSKGRILSFNNAATQIFGSSVAPGSPAPIDARTDARIEDLIEGIDVQALHVLTQPKSDTGKTPGSPGHFIARRADGTVRLLDLQVNRWRTEFGDPRFTCVIRDITTEKRAADALVEAEKRWNFAL